MRIAEFLVGSIDESGYIRLDLQEIIDDLAFTQNLIVSSEELTEVLKIVQEFDPAGVGALSLQDCLIIQLKRKKSSENEKKLIQTITSRCQKIYFRHQSFDNQQVRIDYEPLFLEWVRAAFKVKGNKSAINELMQFSEKVSKKTREEQKDFLIYCSSIFRDSLLYGYKAFNNSKNYNNGLDLKKFAAFVHEENIESFYEEIQKGYYDIERNGNPKIIFLDISVKLTRLLHIKPLENA